MPYRMELFGGDFTENLVEIRYYSEWSDVTKEMLVYVEAGIQCNIIHTDFVPPMHILEQHFDFMENYFQDQYRYNDEDEDEDGDEYDD